MSYAPVEALDHRITGRKARPYPLNVLSLQVTLIVFPLTTHPLHLC